MNNRRALIAHAVRGPVMLIAVGILAAVHQAGVMSFARTWPVLIITLGLMILLERAVTPPAPPYAQQKAGQPYPPPPPAPGVPGGNR